eukprot:Pgem_evm1s15639
MLRENINNSFDLDMSFDLNHTTRLDDVSNIAKNGNVALNDATDIFVDAESEFEVDANIREFENACHIVEDIAEGFESENVADNYKAGHALA